MYMFLSHITLTQSSFRPGIERVGCSTALGKKHAQLLVAIIKFLEHSQSLKSHPGSNGSCLNPSLCMERQILQ